jgi:hypothetical protein
MGAGKGKRKRGTEEGVAVGASGIKKPRVGEAVGE